MPIERVEVENDPLAPIAPSRSEFQFSKISRLPSSTSFAVPVNVTDEPVRKLEPSAGAEMDTVGGESIGGVIVTKTVSATVFPPESVTDAVII